MENERAPLISDKPPAYNPDVGSALPYPPSNEQLPYPPSEQVNHLYLRDYPIKYCCFTAACDQHGDRSHSAPTGGDDYEFW